MPGVYKTSALSPRYKHAHVLNNCKLMQIVCIQDPILPSSLPTDACQQSNNVWSDENRPSPDSHYFKHLRRRWKALISSGLVASSSTHGHDLTNGNSYRWVLYSVFFGNRHKNRDELGNVTHCPLPLMVLVCHEFPAEWGKSSSSSVEPLQGRDSTNLCNDNLAVLSVSL